MKKVLPLAALAFWLINSHPARAARPAGIPNFTPDPNLSLVISPVISQGLGQCWSISPDHIAKDYVSWGYDVGYRWENIEPREGEYHFEYYEESLEKIRTYDKGYLLFFLTGGVNNGDEYNPQWLIDKVKNNNPQNWIEEAHLIAPWDPDWQAGLARLAQALAARYDNDPNVIGVVVPSGCRYGEMSCWCGGAEHDSWVAAGYTDERFVEAVEQSITSFLTYFQNKPVYVQVGGGLNGQRHLTGYLLMEEMYERYGLRVNYKFNGWGSTNQGNIGDTYRGYGGYTSVGYEVGLQPDFSSPTVAAGIIDQALADHVSFGCLGSDLLNHTEGAWVKEYLDFVRYSGTQIILDEYTLSYDPDATSSNLQLTAKFANRGTKPLVAARRVGEKDEAASYNLILYYHPTQRNSWRQKATVSITNPPTDQWYGGQYQPRRVVSATVSAPAINGQYDVYLALENTFSGIHQGERWPIITEGLTENQLRYKIGQVEVTNGSPEESGEIFLMPGKNSYLWIEQTTEINEDVWGSLPGATWISVRTNGFWSTVVRQYNQSLFPLVTGSSYTITTIY